LVGRGCGLPHMPKKPSKHTKLREGTGHPLPVLCRFRIVRTDQDQSVSGNLPRPSGLRPRDARCHSPPGDSEGMDGRGMWRTRTARGLQPRIPCPRHMVCTRADPMVAAKHHHVTGRYINRVAGHAAEPNRQVSCPAGRWARRRIEPSSALSGRTPGTPPNRTVKRAVRQDAGHAAESNRVRQDATEPTRRRIKSCQEGRHRTDTPPNRTTERSVERAVATEPRTIRRANIAQADGRAEYRTAPIRLFRCESLNGGRY
jgi:hypothetical protein